MAPLRFTNSSTPSGWVADFHLRGVEHAQRTKKKARKQCFQAFFLSLPLLNSYLTLMMIMRNVKSTSVSTNARLNNIGVKILFAAPGLRAMPSSAAAPILP